MTSFRNLLAVLVLLSVASTTRAQDFGDFGKEFDKFRDEAEAAYESFREQCNAEYAQFLKEAWEAFNSMPGAPRPKDQERLPQTIVNKLKDAGHNATEASTTPRKDAQVPVSEVIAAPKTASAGRRPQPIGDLQITDNPMNDPEAEKPVSEQVKGFHSFQFYGTQMTVRTPKKKLMLPDTNGETIAEAWKTCSTAKKTKRQYNELLSDCLWLRDKYHLCDWAYLQMLQTMTESYLGEGNAAVFLMAYLYCQSGYQMRMAEAKGRLVMLYASEHGIYEHSFFNIDGQHFYPYGQKESLGRISICNHGFPKEQAMSLLVPEEPLFDSQKPQIRKIQSQEFPDVAIQVSVNRNLLDFFDTYPSSNLNNNFLTRWAMYANTPLDEDVKEQIYPMLRKSLQGLSERDAVCRLLSLIQSGIVYQYDEDIWGYDRPFFAEETLFYPYADCEDRSILFSRLVRDLLGLKAVLIYYPNHLASAVCFNEVVTGDYVQLGKDRYMICDPTNYVAAPGVTMEGMDNSLAKVIMLEN